MFAFQMRFQSKEKSEKNDVEQQNQAVSCVYEGNNKTKRHIVENQGLNIICKLFLFSCL